MFKLCTTCIVLGVGIGAAATVKQAVRDLLRDLDQASSTMATVPVIRATAYVVPSTSSDADRLVQVAQALSIPGERLHSLAQDAASDCDAHTCIEVMTTVWGPDWAERALREINLASTGY